MKIVIVGADKVGYSLAERLASEDHDITVVDIDKEKIKTINDTLDVMAVCGNGAALSVQREANVDESDLLIAVTARDETNILACMLAKKLGCKNTIARVRNLEYTEQVYMLKDELGLSMTINPEMLAAKEIFKLLQMPAFIKRDTFAKGRAEIVELMLPEKCPLDGVKLSDLGRRLRIRVLICAVMRGEEVVIPDGSFKLKAGDKIYVTAPASSLVQLTHELKLRSKKSKNVLIVGGGRIAEFLINMLIKTGVNVKVIERDRARCNYLAERYPQISVICSDGTSHAVLKAHNISGMDAVVALTNIDEENIIIGMFSRKVGVPQLVTKISRFEYGEIFADRGADSLISPKVLSTYAIIRYVRAMQNTRGSSVLTMHKLADSGAEALEFAVTEQTEHLNERLADMKLKPGILIACINRLGRIVIPSGHDKIAPGDTVVVVTTTGREILDLNDIFA